MLLGCGDKRGKAKIPKRRSMMSEDLRLRNSVITVKNVLRVVSFLCIIFVFCPSFLVSCSGQNVNVSVMTAVGGVSVYEEKVVDAHPLMLVCLLLPIAVLVLLCLKKLTEKRTALMILACTGIDLVIWFIFRASVKKIAEENYCSFKTTGWFVLNIIFMILIIVLNILVVVGKLEMESDLIMILSGQETKKVLNQMSATMSQMSNTVTKMAGDVANNIGNKTQKENTIGYCSNCGSAIECGSKFCVTCGTPVPESMLKEAESAKRNEM